MSAELNVISNNGEKKGLNSRVALIVGVFVAILTPMAYLVGYSYYQGYLSAFGVDSDNFPISSSDVYIFSYHAFGFLLLGVGELLLGFINKIFSRPYVGISGSVFAALVAIVYFYLKISKVVSRQGSSKLSIFISKFFCFFSPGRNDLTKSILIVGVPSYFLVSFICLIGAFALFWWSISIAAHNKGGVIAMERIGAFIETGCSYDKKNNWNRCFQVLDKNKKVVREGLLIGVNEKEIAIFEKNGSSIFQKPSGFLLRRKNDRMLNK